MALICQTVQARTMAELRRARDEASDADIVELRLDALAPGEADVAAALDGRTRPVVMTCRAAWEGGAFGGSEEERLEILRRAAAAGAEYVDVEWKADVESVMTAAQRGTQVIVSHHDFSGVPADAADRVRAMRATGAPCVKLAVTAACLRDCLTLRDAMTGRAGDLAVAMGDAGRLTRLLPGRFGARWTYAGAAAPGQLTAAALRHTYRIATTTAATRVFGIAGAPLAHSASPAMHNAAFAAAGLDAIYVPFETGDADDLLEVADALGVEGLSVTAPLKSVLLERCRPGRIAAAIGAVNTLRRCESGWEGQNFDAAAFLAPLEALGVRLAGARTVVLGAGGAARAVAWALATSGARVGISARDADRAKTLADAVGVDTETWPLSRKWKLLVNATPVGTWPHTDESPVPSDVLVGPVVYDLVYNPAETMLMQVARARGATVIGGLDMLLAQAQRQFEWWTGEGGDAAVMRTAAEAWLCGIDARRA